MIGLNNHGEQFNTNKMLQIQKMQDKKSHRDEEDLGGEECSKDGENLSQVEFFCHSCHRNNLLQSQNRSLFRFEIVKS